jgi:hypothetical protein
MKFCRLLSITAGLALTMPGISLDAQQGAAKKKAGPRGPAVAELEEAGFQPIFALP